MLLDIDLNQNKAITKGCLLISEPFLPDPNFERSVILVCDHQENGTFGLILNKPTDMQLSDVSDFTIEELLYGGGPVEANTLHFIHTISAVEGCVELQNGVYWGGNLSQLQTYSNTGILNERNSRFFIGYSGWAKNQLKQEIDQKTWIIADFDLERIFRIDPTELWREVLRSMGGKYKMFANFPADPRLN